MNTQCLTLNHHTRLAVQIIIEDDSGTLAVSILLATRLLTLLCQVGQVVFSVSYEVAMLMDDLKTALHFTGKVLAIGFNALAYGFGVTL